MNLIKTRFGSHLYGLNTPESDEDIASVYVPKASDIVLQTAKDHMCVSTGDKDGKNTKDDIDEDAFSLHYYLKLLHRGEMKAIDILYAPSNKEACIEVDPWFEFLYENRDKYLHTGLERFIGYIYSQAAKYGVKGSRMGELEKVMTWVNSFINTEGMKIRHVQETMHKTDGLPVGEHVSLEKDHYYVLGKKFMFDMPWDIFVKSINNMWSKYGERARQAKENNGIDWKAVSHAVRAAYQLEALFGDGDLKFPFTGEQKTVLMSIKRGEKDWESEVKPYLEHHFNSVQSLAKVANANGIPENLSEEAVSFSNKMCLNAYLNEIIREYA